MIYIAFAALLTALLLLVAVVCLAWKESSDLDQYQREQDETQAARFI
jgi:hypothetical protein